MASETTLTSHQRSYNELKSLVDNGYGIAVHQYRREDGTLMKRYVVPYTTEGNPVRRNDLKRTLDSDNNGLNAPKIRQINALASTIMDSHRNAHDTSAEHKRQAAFYNRNGFHYVKSDEVEREDSHEHKKQPLKTPEFTSYHHALGGTPGEITGEQQEVLDFGPTLVNSDGDHDISAELNALRDKNFVRIFRKIQQDNPATSLSEIYSKALQQYTNDTVKAFQVSIHPDTAVDVANSLQKAAHQNADHSITADAASETWLDDNAGDFGNPVKAQAVFQAIQEVGAKEVGADPDNHTQTTAEHAYHTLLSKVNQYWLEANRDTSIGRLEFFDIPAGNAGAAHHGEHQRPVDERSGAAPAKELLPQRNLTKELTNLEGELRSLTRYGTEIDSAREKYFDSISLIPFRSDSVAQDQANKAWTKAVTEVADNWTVPDFDREQEVLLAYSAPVERFIRTRIQELKGAISLQKLKMDFYRSPTRFMEDLQRLRAQRATKVEEHSAAWRGPIGSKSTIQQQIKALDAQIEPKEALLTTMQNDWNTNDGKRVELLSLYLHLGVGSLPEAEDFRSLSDKVFNPAHHSIHLTPGEIGALRTWQIQQPLDTKDAALVLLSLQQYLDQSINHDSLKEKRTRVLSEVDTSSEGYTTWELTDQSPLHFLTGYKYLRDFNIAPTFALEDETLFALRSIHDTLQPEGLKTGSPEAWRKAMLKALKAKEFEAIQPELKRVAENPTGLNTTLDAIQGLENPAITAEHYLHVHEYLKGQRLGSALAALEIRALLDLLPSAADRENHQKLEFLAKQAFQNYTYLRMGLETHGENLDGWTATEDHLNGAKEWLKDPSQPIADANVKKALLHVMSQDSTSIDELNSRLNQAIRLVKLEASDVDPVGYDYQPEDVLAVRDHLERNGPELTPDQIKAFKKMQADEVVSPETKDKRAHYQTKITAAMASATANVYGGRVVNWETVWDHVDGQLAGFDSTSVSANSITRAHHLEAIRKLTTTPLVALSAEEKYVVHQQHSFMTTNHGADAEKFKGFALLILLQKETPAA